MIADSAIIGPGVEMGKDVQIGNNAILEGDIVVGEGTRIDHNCIVRGQVEIGGGNWIYPNCVIGTGPQHKEFADKYPPDKGRITIGDRNVIREFATIHHPTKSESTRVGSDCYIMSYAHIAHDCLISDNAILATRITLGGHSEIHEYANIGQNTAVHPYCRIGCHAMIGMCSPIVKDALPFSLINRQKFAKVNRVGMERNGIGADDISDIEETYKMGLPVPDTTKWYHKVIDEFAAQSKRNCYLPDFM